MDIYRISFYDAFSCAKGDCPDTCCRGWGVIVDDETYLRYRRERGLTGLRLLLAVRGKEERMLNASRTRCHFLCRDGLCGLQKMKGPSYQPLVCRIFPRKRTNLRLFCEEYLDLSCPVAARLFLAHTNDLTLRVSHGDVTYVPHLDNDDDVFLRALTDSRNRLTSLLLYGEEDGIAGLNRRFVLAHTLAARWQTNASRNADIFSDGETEADVETPDTLFPLPIRELNRRINTVLYADGLKRRMPFLYRLCRLYFRQFDNLDERGGQRRLNGLVRAFEAAGHVDMRKYAAYAAYFLFRYYTETFTDYSFLKRVRDMTLHTNMVFLLDALWADTYGELPDDVQARIISAYEKRVFHSATATRRMS